jgi:hypothetical protein
MLEYFQTPTRLCPAGSLKRLRVATPATWLQSAFNHDFLALGCGSATVP